MVSDSQLLLVKHFIEMTCEVVCPRRKLLCGRKYEIQRDSERNFRNQRLFSATPDSCIGKSCVSKIDVMSALPVNSFEMRINLEVETIPETC